MHGDIRDCLGCRHNEHLSVKYARPFHIQVFHIALITTSTPSQLNQAKANQAKPYSTFPGGKSFAFVLLKLSQLFFSPLCWCLPDPILSSIPLSQPLRGRKRIFHPTLAKHEPHCVFVSISAAAIKTKQTKQKPKKSNFKKEVGFCPQFSIVGSSRQQKLEAALVLLHLQSEEASSECMMLLGFLFSITQSRIPTKEWCTHSEHLSYHNTDIAQVHLPGDSRI